jgi:hypothetical protein
MAACVHDNLHGRRGWPRHVTESTQETWSPDDAFLTVSRRGVEARVVLAELLIRAASDETVGSRSPKPRLLRPRPQASIGAKIKAH